MAEWKTSTVQFNYHIALDGMYYSVPYQYIKKQVESRLTDTAVEVFYGHERIASHARLRGRPGQYSTVKAHMPEGHREYLEWDGDRFRRWASGIGEKTAAVIDALLMDLSAAEDRHALENALQKYTKPTLLIIDEWLLFKLRENEARLLLEVIHKRRKKSSTIFCSQYEEKDWYNQICDGESTLADAIMDRISFDSYKINIEYIDKSVDKSMWEVYGLNPSEAQ